MKWLDKLIDSFFTEMKESGFPMMTSVSIPKEMQDTSIDAEDGYYGWKPIPSIIEDSDIDKLESAMGYPLPLSYREFLKTKHFYELLIPDDSVRFPRFLPDKNLPSLREYVFDMMEPEFIIGRGYIYFADFNDYGLLCFDANKQVENHEYPVVFMDHDDYDSIHLYADNFRALLEADQERGNEFIEYLNESYNK